MQTVSFAGSSYNIPNTRGDRPWGGLSDFVIAAASKAINTAGGNFTLLADINFGATFGLVSTYYKSRTAGVADAGQLRLANADTIQWRNAAGDGNLSLALSTNTLQFNGTSIPLSGAIVNADISASAAIVFSKMAALSNSIVPVTNGSGVITSSAVTATELGYVSGVSSAIQTQLNTKATDTLVVHLAGAETITGAKTFQDQTLKLQETGSTDVITINIAALAASRAYTMPDAGSAAEFVMNAGASTIAGEKTLSNRLILSNGSVGTPSFGFASSTATGLFRTASHIISTASNGTEYFRIDNDIAGQVTTAGNCRMYSGDGAVGAPAHSFAADPDNGLYRIGTNNIGIAAGGTKAIDIASTGVAVLGTTTNDSAAAGFVGQYIESVVGNTTMVTTGNWQDLTSISLTAGDWDVTVLIYMNNQTSFTQGQGGISTTSGNSATGLVAGSNFLSTSVVSNTEGHITVANYRMSLSATTTVYGKAKAIFTGTQPQFSGRLSARRMR